MPIQPPHSWNLNPTESELGAGADISYNKFSDVIYAGIVVLRWPMLEVVATSGVVTTAQFPSRSGLLSFRETPPLFAAEFFFLKTMCS